MLRPPARHERLRLGSVERRNGCRSAAHRIADGVSCESYRNTPERVLREWLETEPYIPLA
jgi:hypothetical protein